MSEPVSQSITRRSASNLALAFILLPPEKRQAMAALYAFCRQVDDVADEEQIPLAERRRQLVAWREDLGRACAGQPAQIPVNRELTPVIARYRLPFGLFDEILRGVEMDLDVQGYETYAELEQYCYRVASAVGLLSIEIFGYRNPGCAQYAVALGKALQFTNILRDVRNDAERGRVYLPREALAAAGLKAEAILRAADGEPVRRVARAFGARARQFYAAAAALLPPEDRAAMIAAELMGAVYWRLFRRLETLDYPILRAVPVRVGKPMKVLLILRTWLRLKLGSRAPNYGCP